MPQMAPMAWIYLFLLITLVFSLILMKLFFTPSNLINKTYPSPLDPTSLTKGNKLWEW